MRARGSHWTATSSCAHTPEELCHTTKERRKKEKRKERENNFRNAYTADSYILFRSMIIASWPRPRHSQPVSLKNVLHPDGAGATRWQYMSIRGKTSSTPYSSLRREATATFFNTTSRLLRGVRPVDAGRRERVHREGGGVITYGTLHTLADRPPPFYYTYYTEGRSTVATASKSDDLSLPFFAANEWLGTSKVFL